MYNQVGMLIGRTIRYGLLYWLTSAVITLAEVQAGASGTVIATVFYSTIVIFPILFFGLYARRGVRTFEWKDALMVGGVWIVIFLVLDSILYLKFYQVPAQVYFSWHWFLEFGLLLVIGVLVSKFRERWQRAGGTEGLS